MRRQPKLGCRDGKHTAKLSASKNADGGAHDGASATESV